MSCTEAARVHRYFDRELPAGDVPAVELHIQACPECGRLLADLRRLTSLLEAAPLAEMPAGVVVRLRQRSSAVADRRVLRTAAWLTTAAAAVLVASLLTWPAERPNAVGRPGIWETIAVSSPHEIHDENGSELVLVAEWMEDDLSVTGGDLR